MAALVFDTVHLAARVLDPEGVAKRLGDQECLNPHLHRGGRNGHIGHLKTKLVEDMLTIKGSWTRHAQVGFLSVTAARDVLNDLETRVGESLHTAEVWRLDVYADLGLSMEVGTYLPLLTEYPRMERVQVTKGSLRFQNKRRALAFYDKAAERRRRGQAPPPGNVLRYELRLLRRIREQLGGVVLLPSLLDPSFRERMTQAWLNHYRRVKKERVSVASPPKALTPKSLKRWLTAKGIEQVGLRCVLDTLERAHAGGDMPTSTYYNERRRALEIAMAPDLTVTHDSMKELDSLVQKAAEHMRCDQPLPILLTS